MKTAKMLTILVLAPSLAVWQAEVSEAAPMGTAWTYQGRLMDANNVADGLYDFVFGLFDGPDGAGELGAQVIDDLDVIDGYFTVELDFGSDIFDGSERWLQIEIRPGELHDPNEYTMLGQRQRVDPTPYALQTRGIFVDDVPYIIDYPDAWTAKESNRRWYSVALSADGTKQTAVAAFGQIYISTDSGNTWTAKQFNANWHSVAMSGDGTKQTAVVLNGQIYVSTDSGDTWTAKESNRGWYSVAMSADGTKQTAVVYNGQIYVSTDSGNTWTAKESNRYWQSIAMSADGTQQTAVADTEQIYVSTDSGNTWTAKESNRRWVSVAISEDGKRQTAVVSNGQIYVSADWGNTWTAKESNRSWTWIAMSADGTKQTAVVYGGQIYVSMDWGNTWTAKESDRQWVSISVSADGTKQTAVVYQGQIYVCSADVSYSYKVGIGTTSPSYKLDVDGDIRANYGAVYANGLVDLGSPWYFVAPGYYNSIHVAGGIVTDLGPVGIGTAEPEGTLHVDGGQANPAIDGTSIILKAEDGGDTVGQGCSGGDVILQAGDATGSHDSSGAPGNILLLPGSAVGKKGYVGIGTTNPLADLHIASASPTVLFDNSIATDWTLDSGGIAGGVFSIREYVNSVERLVLKPGGDTLLVPQGGNVGIGTDSPVAKLDIQGDENAIVLARINQVGTNNYMGLRYDRDGTEKWFIGMTHEDDGLIFSRDAAFDDMVIDTSGHVGIGTTAPGQFHLAVNGRAAKAVGGTAWETFSDVRLKDIHDTYDKGLDEIAGLTPLVYTYRKDNELNLPSDTPAVGLSAQEVRRVIPEAVTENEKGYLMLNGDPVMMAMLNAIKELKTENDYLRQKLEALEKRMDESQFAFLKEVQQ